MKTRNPVAKFQMRYNKAKVFKNRKKEQKRGHEKHKGALAVKIDRLTKNQ